MNAQHTPTPWHVVKYDAGDSDHLSGVPSIVAADEMDCTIVHYNGFAQEYWRFERGDREMQANAAFIVRACNSHEVLVAALKAAAKLAWEVGCETDDGVMTLLEDSRGDLYRQITAALALAGEGA